MAQGTREIGWNPPGSTPCSAPHSRRLKTLIRRHAGRREADEQENESRRRRANLNTEQWDSVSPLFTSLPVPGTDHSLLECGEFKTWLQIFDASSTEW